MSPSSHPLHAVLLLILAVDPGIIGGVHCHRGHHAGGSSHASLLVLVLGAGACHHHHDFPTPGTHPGA
jgi:hypothetical protein